METNYLGNSMKSGVYKIYNKENGRIYIGSAKRFKERYMGHFSSLKRNKHHNIFLQGDFNKFGEQCFLFEVLEVVPGDKSNRQIKEQEYINKYYDNQLLCYNLDKKAKLSAADIKQKKEHSQKKSELLKIRWATDLTFREKMSGKNHPRFGKEIPEHIKLALLKSLVGNTHFKGKKHTEIAKKKLSDKHKGKKISKEQKEAHSKLMTGRKLSLKHRNNISLGNIGRKQSEHQKSAVSLKNSKLFNIELISPDGNVFGPIKNLAKFARDHNLSSQKLHLLITKKRKSHKGWKLVY